MQMEGGRITFSEQKSCFFLFLKEKSGDSSYHGSMPVAAGMGCRSAAARGAGRALLCPGATGHAGGEGSEDSMGKGTHQNQWLW